MKPGVAPIGAIVLSVGVALSGIAWSVSQGLADLMALGPRSAMLQWKRDLRLPEQSEVRAHIDIVDAASTLAPRDASLRAERGRLVEWSALRHPLWSTEARALRQEAIVLYGEALARRPVWALMWAQLAKTKLLAGRWDSEAEQALERAMILGSKERGVQSTILRVGMPVWPQLSQSVRDEFLRTVDIAFRNNYREVIRQAVHYRWDEPLQRFLVKDEHNEFYDIVLLSSLTKGAWRGR